MRKNLDRIASRSRGEEGLSVMELVIAMAISSLVMILAASIFIATTRTQNDIQNATTGTGQAQLVISQLSKSVRTASAFRIPANNRVEIRTPEGQCLTWLVTGSKLYRKVSSGANGSTIDSTWSVMAEPVNAIGSTPFFAPGGGTGLAYSMNTGESISNIDIVGNTAPRAVGATTAPCW